MYLGKGLEWNYSVAQPVLQNNFILSLHAATRGDFELLKINHDVRCIVNTPVITPSMSFREVLYWHTVIHGRSWFVCLVKLYWAQNAP